MNKIVLLFYSHLEWVLNGVLLFSLYFNLICVNVKRREKQRCNLDLWNLFNQKFVINGYMKLNFHRKLLYAWKSSDRSPWSVHDLQSLKLFKCVKNIHLQSANSCACTEVNGAKNCTKFLQKLNKTQPKLIVLIQFRFKIL